MSVCCLAVVAASLGCRKPPQEVPTVQLLAGNTMGTSYQVKLVPYPRLDVPELAQRVEAELKLVNEQMSTYLPDSELSRFNHSTAVDEWVAVSQDTATVVDLGLDVSRWTEGAFDTTVGRLVNAWGFGPGGSFREIPTDAEVQELLDSTGFERVQVRIDPPALRKSHASLHVDLSAIAKGHGVDRIAHVLDASGATDYFIEVGGEVRTRGQRLDGTPWRVGIELPLDDQREIFTALELSDAALATSGNYRNFFISDGVRLSHTIDPRTGRPVQHTIASASVVADNCALADALATGMMALGVAEGLRLAEQHNWAVLLLEHADNGELAVHTSSEFQRRYPDWQSEAAAADAATNEGLRP